MNNLLQSMMSSVYDALSDFAQSEGFWSKSAIAFGTNYDLTKLTSLRNQWQNEDFSQLPSIEVVSSSVLGGAKGAYAISGNKIYLSDSFLATGTPEAIKAVILEEVGHYVDAKINLTDSAGDEGDIFSRLVRGESLNAETLQVLQAENDSGIINLGGEAIAVEQNTNLLRTAAGDGELQVTVDEFGRFGGASVGDAFYDPIGSISSSGTTYRSLVALGIIGTGGTTEGRIELRPSVSNDETFTSTNNTTANSTFTVNGLRFQLQQIVEDTFSNTTVRSGSRLNQTYTITNTTGQTINFDLVRYIDGDLLFDGTISDGGGRIAQGGQEILFETDRGGTGETSTTFVGILGTGGTIPTTNRWEIDRFGILSSNVFAGNPLRNIIVNGDNDSNQFIDPGAEYDVTLALRNVFSLAPGQSTTYTTTTLFGSGLPAQAITPNITLSLNYSGISENSPTNFVYTFTRTGGDLANPLTVNYTLGGTATLNTDYTRSTINNTVTFAAGSSTATVILDPTGDSIKELNETAIVTLAQGTGYTIGTSSPVTATIIDDDGILSVSQQGTSGNDAILGTNLLNSLVGGLGNDVLTGGSGVDLFTFQSPNEGVDTLTNFTLGSDFIVVKAAGFGGGLTLGSIRANQFVIGTAATTSTHRLIYNNATGALFFDVDGNGLSAAQQLATLNPNLALTNQNILVS